MREERDDCSARNNVRIVRDGCDRCIASNGQFI